MKIVKFSGENIKRLTAVDITPGEGVVVLGGENRAGKSSVLDAIEMALAGAGAIPPRPIHDGAKKGRVELDLGTLQVIRTFTPSGGTLTVTTPDGERQKQPQAILDEFVGRLSFDPMAFCQAGPAEQVRMIQAIIPELDFAEHDRKRLALYDERTLINRDLKAAAAVLAARPRYDDGPEAEVVTADLVAELERRQAVNRANGERRQAALRLVADAQQAIGRTEEALRDVRRLETELANARAAAVRAQAEQEAAAEKATQARGAAVVLRDEDLDAVRARIAGAENANRKVRANAAHAEAKKRLVGLEAAANAVTRQIERMDAEKERRIASAKFPVEGLGLSDVGVTFHGLPFEQASQSEQIETSLGIGMAANLELKVIFVRQGALLDDRHFDLVVKAAREKGYQVWIEDVGDRRATVVIEDGAVKAAEVTA